MSILDQDARSPLKQRLTFEDGYVWEEDYLGNHRLMNSVLEQTTGWIKSVEIAVLNDFMLIGDAYKGGRLPTHKLIQWIRAFPPQKTEMYL